MGKLDRILDGQIGGCMKKVGNILEGIGLLMFLLTGCVDNYEGSTLRFLMLISMWVISSIILILLGDYLSNFKIKVRKCQKKH